MKDQKKTEIKVGVIVLAGLLVLIILFSWAKNLRVFSEQQEISIRFDTVAGLENGDPVTVNGVRKGFVEEIKVEGNYALVKINIDPDIKLKKDAVFAVSMLDLMGGKKIEIQPGTSAEQLNMQSVQNGVFYADIPAVMAMLGSVQEDLINIIKEVQVTLGSMNKVLTDEDFNSKLKTSLTNLTEISHKLNLMLDENRNNLRIISKNTAELTSETSQFIKDNKENIKASLAEVKEVMSSANELLSKLNTMADETTGRKNNLGKLMYDEQIIADLKTSLQQVKDLTKLLVEQLQGEGINVDANIDVW